MVGNANLLPSTQEPRKKDLPEFEVGLDSRVRTSL